MRIYRARKDLFFREISATIMVGSMKRKKVRKPQRMREASVVDFMGTPAVFVGEWICGPKDCRRLARWLDRAAEYLESREGK